jgi:hypothetical protein
VVDRDRAAFRDLEEGLAERLALGSRATTLLAVVHAEACLVMGEIGRGLAGLDEAIAFGEDSGEGVNLAELHRLKGLLLAKTNRTDADAYLRRALELAQASSAKAFELRAAMGLAHLWHSTKQHPEAISRLAEVVAGFTEGFSGADLVEAKQVLDEARQQRPQARRRRA